MMPIEESIPPRRRRSFRQIIFFGSIGLLLLIIAAHLLWGVLANYSLNRAIARLHASGEPTTPQDIHLDDVPDSQNASLDFKAAGLLVRVDSADWKTIADAPTGAFTFPLTPTERPVLHAIVDDNRAPLKLISQARGKLPGGWNDNISHPSILLNLDFSTERRVARLIQYSAINQQDQGHDGDALQSLCDGLALADAAQRRPLLMGHLIALGCEALATETAASFAPTWKVGQNGLDRLRIIALIKMLQDESSIDQGDKLAYRTERLFTVRSLKDMADGTLALTGTAPGAFSYLFRPTLRDDARICLGFYQDVMTAAAAPDWVAAKQLYPHWFKEKVEGSYILHPGAAMLAPSMETAIRVSFHTRTQRRLASVALAVRLYAADHGDQLPTSLAELVPDYLPAVPIDPMSGQPLLYKSDPPRVYSVGDDGIDDGGIPPNPKYQSRNTAPGDLVVYLTAHPRLYPFDKASGTTKPVGTAK